MPLPSLLKGAKQCQVMTKRSKLRCKNPAAYGCKACRMHGAHKSRNVLRGANHPQYKNGERTKEAETEHRRAAIALLTLQDVGDSIGMFNSHIAKGRKPAGYIKYDMNDPVEIAYAILSTISKNK